MPSILIETRYEHPEQMEVNMMEAVHAAVRHSFKILPHDRNVRLIAHKPHRFECPPGKNRPELYTHISIDCFAGRSIAAKRDLYRGIVNNLEVLGIPKDHVKILLREITAENWGIRGGQAACDVELGFKVDV